ncbi:beta-lactamase family protein [Phlyctema vagabunda]|uniref:Beta-lactamase family protein n=1 Tax=Phlyctema vagabunda TaxID=108571 RepID=A0ABR4PHE0_9HELO
MVERVSNMSLEEYFRINIWQPLHIEDMTFRPHTNALVQKNFTEMSVRQGGVSRYGTPADPAGKLEAASSQTYWSATSDSDDCHGGSGLYGSMPSYHKILQTFLSSPSRLLRGSSIDAMFTPQLNAVSQAALVRVLSIPEVNTAYGSVGPVADPDCGLGGILNRRALDSGRPACSLTWCGYPGLVWWVDRTAGVVGIWGAQLAPPGDERLAVLQREWEREIYERVRGTGEGKRDEEEESDAKGKL